MAETDANSATAELEVRDDRARLPSAELVDKEGPVRQGEIFSSLCTYTTDLDSFSSNNNTVTTKSLEKQYPYLICVSQDCDLSQHFYKSKGEPRSPHLHPFVLFIEAMDASEFVSWGKEKEHAMGGIWKQIKGNQHARYQFLDSVPQNLDNASQGIPELVCDFKRVIALPSSHIYSLDPNSGILVCRHARRCALVSPYKEDFQQRFTAFLGRVGLDLPHRSI